MCVCLCVQAHTRAWVWYVVSHSPNTYHSPSICPVWEDMSARTSPVWITSEFLEHLHKLCSELQMKPSTRKPMTLWPDVDAFSTPSSLHRATIDLDCHISVCLTLGLLLSRTISKALVLLDTDVRPTDTVRHWCDEREGQGPLCVPGPSPQWRRYV